MSNIKYNSMYLAINPMQFNIHYVMLSDKTKNNVMENGDFYRVYYSDHLCNSNGLYIYFTLQNAMIEKYFNKIKCSFNYDSNKNIIKNLKMIEKQILRKSSLTNKHIYRIEEQLTNQYIKIFTDKNIEYGKNEKLELVLKISGIWSDFTSCGVTFRFYLTNHLL